MKQWSGFWICSGFISALSVIFKQQRAKQISLALHCWHCWLIWLTDEYKMICNSFSVSKQMKRRPALVWMEGVALLFTSACRTRRSRRMRLDVGQLSAGWRGWAPSPGGQQSATVKGSIYPRCHRERSSGRGQPLSSHGCVNVCVCVHLCRGSNLLCAGGYSLFQMIDSLCSLYCLKEGSQHPATYTAVYLPKSSGGILSLGPTPASLMILAVSYDVINAYYRRNSTKFILGFLIV